MLRSIDHDTKAGREEWCEERELVFVNGLEGLRGVTIDEYQLSLFAPLFATHLGVVVD